MKLDDSFLHRPIDDEITSRIQAEFKSYQKK